MRTAGFWPPESETRPTPGSCAIFCTSRVSARSCTAVSGSAFEVSASVSTGASAGLTLLYTGGFGRSLGRNDEAALMAACTCCSAGSSVITLQFDLALALDIAEQQVQAAINAASSFLPKDLPNPPVYSKVNPADAPVLTLALTSAALPLTAVQDLADTRLVQKIAQLPGVGLVTLSGGQKPAVRIQVNPALLAGYGLTLDDVRTAVSAANVNQAKGSLDGPLQSFTIAANDQIHQSHQY